MRHPGTAPDPTSQEENLMALLISFLIPGLQRHFRRVLPTRVVGRWQRLHAAPDSVDELSCCNAGFGHLSLRLGLCPYQHGFGQRDSVRIHLPHACLGCAVISAGNGEIPSVCSNRNSIACKSQGNETFCLAVSRHGPVMSARGVRCMDPRRVYASLSSSLMERRWTSPRDMRLKPTSGDVMTTAERT